MVSLCTMQSLLICILKMAASSFLCDFYLHSLWSRNQENYLADLDEFFLCCFLIWLSYATCLFCRWCFHLTHSVPLSPYGVRVLACIITEDIVWRQQKSRLKPHWRRMVIFSYNFNWFWKCTNKITCCICWLLCVLFCQSLNTVKEV